MNIKLIEETEMKEEIPTKKKFEIKEEKEDKGEKCQIKEVPLEQIPEGMMFCEEVSCERTAIGMLNNCSICQAVNGDIFARCKTKYK